MGFYAYVVSICIFATLAVVNLPRIGVQVRRFQAELAKKDLPIKQSPLVQRTIKAGAEASIVMQFPQSIIDVKMITTESEYSSGVNLFNWTENEANPNILILKCANLPRDYSGSLLIVTADGSSYVITVDVDGLRHDDGVPDIVTI